MDRLFFKVVFALLISSVTPQLWPYGQKQVRGVNLGSWLVLEKWMVPDLFNGLPDTVHDEYTFCQYLGYAAAQQRLEAHWNSWITEQDFAAMKNAGLNHVRLPIGYWAVDIQPGEPWVKGSFLYVQKAADWCKKYGLQLMIDLHGAPGSQNGEDHSGRAGTVGFFYNDDNLIRASKILGSIANWANSTSLRGTVTVIELLNEPLIFDDYSFRLNKLKQYYRMAYDEIRTKNWGIVVAIHDAFIDYNNWYYLRDDPHYYWIMLDTHLYQVYSADQQTWTCDQHYAYPCSYRQKLTAANNKLWTVTGEWSLATPKNCPNKALFASQQIGAYEVASGWFFWAYRNPYGDWSFQSSYNNGYIRPNGPNTAVC